ncbi:MAG TPA: LamG domain-containing protein, partial [Natronoarchaeum rubrum]|nr:LamG domain-containing protein [Natronoarchaeum rubrum]
MSDGDESDATGTVAHWSFDEGAGSTVEEAVSGRVDAIEHAFDDARFKPDEDPRWIDGVDGRALLFDGYSTRLEHGGTLFDDGVGALTIETWIAPRAFEGGATDRLSAVASQHSIDDDRGFEFGLDGHDRGSFQVGLGDSWASVRTADPLPRYAWSHVAGVFDGDEGRLRIYVDGDCAASESVPTGSTIAPADVPVRIGKNSTTERVGDA